MPSASMLETAEHVFVEQDAPPSPAIARYSIARLKPFAAATRAIGTRRERSYRQRRSQETISATDMTAIPVCGQGV
jgi:hypothetical protein